jgi:hypothetical protein
MKVEITMIGLAIFLLMVGLFNTLAPRAAWYGSIGWKLRDAEPSDVYLAIARMGGVAACIISIVIFISAATWDDGSASEKTLRSELAGHVDTMMINNQAASNTAEVVNWVRSAEWTKPDVDYRNQAFSWKDEVDMRFVDGYTIAVFYKGDGQFGVGDNVLYPTYMFTSPQLESWIQSQQ